MALSYIDFEACIRFTSRKLGLTDDVAATDEIETLLILSAGKVDEILWFRPYYVMALLLGRQAHDDILTKAESGVTFGDPERTIRGWLEMQRSLDTALSLVVPAGFEAAAVPLTASSASSAVPVVVTF